VWIQSPEVRPFLGATLGPTFANPSIVKVFHGANSDVLWLQRDFGLYVVNMFDTGQAARYLGYASFSLSFLLEKHAHLKDISVMKRRYQMSDWRIRPLEIGQLMYARSDTHYLLAVYDALRCELALRGEDVSADYTPPSQTK
jgi:exosome complex exonuclease RRP6